jgi:hypothetical protein
VALGDSTGFASTSSFGTFVGALSGGRASVLITGNNNSSFGYGSMGSLSTANVSGLSNTAIGSHSFARITTGNYNTAVGGGTGDGVTVGAGRFLTTGSSNAFFGGGAGQGITTQNNNTAIGNSALYSSSGAGNTGVGKSAGSSFTSSNNTVIGHNAASGVTSGTVDAFGYNAGASLRTGTINFALGNEALSAGAGTTFTGNDNMGMGYQALYGAASLGAISFNRNVAIGRNAISISAGADDNTAIGNRAMSGGGATAVSGDNNIAIGSYSLLASLSSSNQITFWVGGSPGYNALTRFTGGQWLLNNTTSAVTAAPNASAAFEVNGTTGGILFPRLTTAQRDALTAVAGMVVWNTTTTKLEVYDGAAWTALH